MRSLGKSAKPEGQRVGWPEIGLLAGLPAFWPSALPALRRSRLTLDDFDDAIRIDSHGLVITKKHNQPVIPRGADFPRVGEPINRTVVQPHGKGSERLSLGELFDFFHVHDWKVFRLICAASGNP